MAPNSGLQPDPAPDSVLFSSLALFMYLVVLFCLIESLIPPLIRVLTVLCEICLQFF